MNVIYVQNLLILVAIAAGQPARDAIDIDPANTDIVPQQVYRYRRLLKPHMLSCSVNQYFDTNEGRCLGVAGGGKAVSIDYSKSCGINILKPHCTNPKYYYICKKDKIILAQCAGGQRFENRLKRCVYADSNDSSSHVGHSNQETVHHVETPICKKPGRFPVPDHCALFYTCETNGHRMFKNVLQCPQGMEYDPLKEACTFSSTCGNTKSNSSVQICVPYTNTKDIVSENKIQPARTSFEAAKTENMESAISDTTPLDAQLKYITSTKSYDSTTIGGTYGDEGFTPIPVYYTKLFPRESTESIGNSDITLTSTESVLGMSRSLNTIDPTTTSSYSATNADDQHTILPKEFDGYTEIGTTESLVPGSYTDSTTEPGLSKKNSGVDGKMYEQILSTTDEPIYYDETMKSTTEADIISTTSPNYLLVPITEPSNGDFNPESEIGTTVSLSPEAYEDSSTEPSLSKKNGGVDGKMYEQMLSTTGEPIYYDETIKSTTEFQTTDIMSTTASNDLLVPITELSNGNLNSESEIGTAESLSPEVYEDSNTEPGLSKKNNRVEGKIYEQMLSTTDEPIYYDETMKPTTEFLTTDVISTTSLNDLLVPITELSNGNLNTESAIGTIESLSPEAYEESNTEPGLSKKNNKVEGKIYEQMLSTTDEPIYYDETMKPTTEFLTTDVISTTSLNDLSVPITELSNGNLNTESAIGTIESLSPEAYEESNTEPGLSKKNSGVDGKMYEQISSTTGEPVYYDETMKSTPEFQTTDIISATSLNDLSVPITELSNGNLNSESEIGTTDSLSPDMKHGTIESLSPEAYEESNTEPGLSKKNSGVDGKMYEQVSSTTGEPVYYDETMKSTPEFQTTDIISATSPNDLSVPITDSGNGNLNTEPVNYVVCNGKISSSNESCADATVVDTFGVDKIESTTSTHFTTNPTYSINTADEFSPRKNDDITASGLDKSTQASVILTNVPEKKEKSFTTESLEPEYFKNTSNDFANSNNTDRADYSVTGAPVSQVPFTENRVSDEFENVPASSESSETHLYSLDPIEPTSSINYNLPETTESSVTNINPKYITEEYSTVPICFGSDDEIDDDDNDARTISAPAPDTHKDETGHLQQITATAAPTIVNFEPSNINADTITSLPIPYFRSNGSTKPEKYVALENPELKSNIPVTEGNSRKSSSPVTDILPGTTPLQNKRVSDKQAATSSKVANSQKPNAAVSFMSALFNMNDRFGKHTKNIFSRIGEKNNWMKPNNSGSISTYMVTPRNYKYG